jgi:hypothetical protein
MAKTSNLSLKVLSGEAIEEMRRTCTAPVGEANYQHWCGNSKLAAAAHLNA